MANHVEENDRNMKLSPYASVFPLLLLIACHDERSIEYSDSEQPDPAVARARLSAPPPPTMAPMNSAFIAYAEPQVFSFAKDQGNAGRLGWYPAPLDMSHNTHTQANTVNLFADNALPDSLDLRTTGRISPVRDQGNCGACWTFASFASLESHLLPEEVTDFSEQHLKNNHGFALEPCVGGNIWMSMAYLTRWEGPHFEADDPYSPDSTISESVGTVRKHVQEVILFPSKTGPLDHDHIKQALFDYGALYVTMCWDYDADGGSNRAYYYSRLDVQGSYCPPGTGHAVTLAGYDDTISADSFAAPPPGDGAYIMKNSWGTDNGDDGYYYVSYHDGNFGYLTIASLSAETVANHDHQYAYDPFGAVSFYGWGGLNVGNNTWYAATFTATGLQRIDAVSTYARYAETRFLVDVYLNSQIDVPISGTKIAADIPYTTTYPGFYTIPIPQRPLILPDDTFSIVIRVSSPSDSSGFTVPVEQYSAQYTPNATSNPGETSTSMDGIVFFDLADVKASANIKAFTTDIGCDTDASCDDGDVCNGMERCIDDDCVSGDPLSCDNGIFCDGPEHCDPGQGCLSGEPIQCDDQIECTNDSCDEPTKSCTHTAIHSRCDNGRFCDGEERCDMTVGCISGQAIRCDDGVTCTTNRCDEETDSCRYTPEDRVCDNGVFCDGVERCDSIKGCTPGVPVSCYDGIDCTEDLCDETIDACLHIGRNARCENGQFCDGAEICDPQTGCRPGTEEHCDDDIPCTLDICDEAEDRCRHTPQNAPCDNGVFCDGMEICDRAAGCIPGPAVVCDDGITCTEDGCDEAARRCIHTPRDEPCDNGLYCDGEERCDPAKGCVAGEPIQCEDGIGCTQDRCDEEQDGCVHTGINALCDDGNPCTVDICRERQGCSADPIDAPCNDGSFCNGTDSCRLGTCIHSGDPCDINEVCDETLDICAPLCDGCDIGGICYPDGASHPQTPCRVCDVSISISDWADASHTPCDDGIFCNGEDACQAGVCVHMGDPCSAIEICSETARRCELRCEGCDINGACYPDGAMHPDHPCMSCDAEADKTDWSLETGTACDDGNPCTSNICEQGSCRTTALPNGAPCAGDNTVCMMGQCITLPDSTTDTSDHEAPSTDRDADSATETGTDSQTTPDTSWETDSDFPLDTSSGETDARTEPDTSWPDTSWSAVDSAPLPETDMATEPDTDTETATEFPVFDTNEVAPMPADTGPETDAPSRPETDAPTSDSDDSRLEDTASLRETDETPEKESQESDLAPPQSARDLQTIIESDTSTDLEFLKDLTNGEPFEAPDLGCGCTQVGHPPQRANLFRLLMGI